MEPLQQQAPTYESVWAQLQEFGRKMAESSAKFDREIEKSRAEWNDRMREADKRREESNADWERRMKALENTTGSWASNHGSFAEEYFFNAFEQGKQNFFGEKFDRIKKNVPSLNEEHEDEYDILLINGKSIGIIEVKYKAHKNDIPKILNKAITFRYNFPNYAHHQVYLGLASLAFYPILEQECINQGIAIIKQVGEKVIIYDKHLKAF